MKKTIAAIIVLVISLQMCGCDSENSISKGDLHTETHQSEVMCTHVQTEWIVDQEPSINSSGTKREVCCLCGKTQNVMSMPYALRSLDQCYGFSTIQNPFGNYLSIEDGILTIANQPYEWSIESCGKNRFYLKDSAGFQVLEYYRYSLKMEEDTGYTEQHWLLLENEDGAIVIVNADSPNYYLHSDEVGNLSVVRKENADEGCFWYIQVENLEPGLPYFEVYGEKGVIYLRLSPDVLNIVTYERLQQWANDLELAYDAYIELTGWRPFSSVEVRGYTNCGGWGYVYREKPVIHVNKDCLYEDLEKMSNRNNDWNFGVLHEMSHLFDKEKWGFEWETLAHYKVAYVLYKYDAYAAPAEFPVGSLFSHNTIGNAFYRLDGKLGDGNGSIQKSLAGKLLEITETVGWDAVRETFCNFPELTNVSSFEKFEYFLNLLSENSSNDIKGMFTNEEWNAVVDEMS